MQNMTLGNLSFICGPAPASAFGCTLQTPVQGLDAADYRIVNYPIPGQDNARVSSAFYDARTITLPGMVSGQNPAQYEANRILLSQACSLNRDANGYPTPTKLSFTTLGGSSYFINVIAKKPVFDMTYPTWSKFVINLMAPDPRIYATTQQNSGAVTTTLGGGFVVPVVVPIVSNTSTGGIAFVNNSGTTDSHPILTLTGPLTNPYIVNTTTGYAFQLDFTIPGGSYVTIDMYEQSVMLNGTSPMLSYIDPISSWWTIVPGNNTFSLSTASSTDTGNVLLFFYSAFEGI